MADMTKRRDLLQNLIDKVEFAGVFHLAFLALVIVFFFPGLFSLFRGYFHT